MTKAQFMTLFIQKKYIFIRREERAGRMKFKKWFRIQTQTNLESSKLWEKTKNWLTTATDAQIEQALNDRFSIDYPREPWNVDDAP